MKLYIVGICGSLRKNSYNKALLESAKKFAPKDVNFSILEIGDLPFFNEDLETNLPKSVDEFRKTILNADAILFSTPEYNYSIPAVLKNAIEWGSRPYGADSLSKKPVAIMGASMGLIGTARAQYHFRQMCVQANMFPLNSPEVFVTSAQEKIDEKGNITDEYTKGKVKELVEALVVWAKKMR